MAEQVESNSERIERLRRYIIAGHINGQTTLYCMSDTRFLLAELDRVRAERDQAVSAIIMDRVCGDIDSPGHGVARDIDLAIRLLSPDDPIPGRIAAALAEHDRKATEGK